MYPLPSRSHASKRKHSRSWSVASAATSGARPSANPSKSMPSPEASISKMRWISAELVPEQRAIWNSAREMIRSSGLGSGSGSVRLRGPANSVAERHLLSRSLNRVCKSARSALVSSHVRSTLYRLRGVRSPALMIAESAAVRRGPSTGELALTLRSVGLSPGRMSELVRVGAAESSLSSSACAAPSSCTRLSAMARAHEGE
mmetsp:Transcript_20895/g.57392  ORF Transcript_20895/g.57392 Transcript_20895/m.57392 type:complete len:202 (-) Transcript_20895:61-666(-)|eukprot:scaffold292126_cov28-Tisochrysis_lutea.AAC.3